MNSTKENEAKDSSKTSSSQNEKGTGEKKSKINVTLYFANEDNSAIPSEVRELELQDDNPVKAVIEALLKGPESSGLRKSIPEGTKLLNSYIKDSVAYVDFSKDYLKANDIAEVVERISIVNTLTAIEGINKVKILVEGKDLIGPSGEPFGELSRAALDGQGKPIPGEIKKNKTLLWK